MLRFDDDGIWLHLEERIAVHHEEIFAALSSGGALTRWLPVAAEVDAREGGTIVFGWDENLRRTTTVAILAFDPGGRIVWDWEAGLEGRHAPIYWEVVPDVEQGSIVRFQQGPFPDDRDGLLLLADEAVFWCWHLCNLRSSYEAKLDMRKVRPL